MRYMKIRKEKMQSFKMALPNIITFMNLFFGISAILVVSGGSKGLSLACVFILFSATLDRLDGKVARKLKAESELGEQLDSLVDLVSFGVAPAFITWNMIFSSTGIHILGYTSVIIYIFAGAYRLAKFNISTCRKVYVGLPITCAGGLLILYNIYLIFTNSIAGSGIKTSVIMIVLAYLMVCKVEVKKM
ncbi:CDP-diacylglycerol--serine O-phosphatidyltransferase [Oceanirhabdus sp. W0125-5]|uniref:CDP-diacylglycerol--serine O-phosphatidyltransferase n=1 Tax=Oceanirhabdus sp. W0125-5 TaxID=2999116 RepID=UPI0022F2B403|nr:CDP-diacylglycerol--serine O-phosphatidyltransferase [Oceanirhabdus sp. W0125-5]WBW96536.1 CDP-diacylglycerol--serine O-phosphatidyltransferase [Oceanirhabdus sp. W0125-5]